MLSLHDREPLVFVPSFPPHWKAHRLPGAGPYYWSGSDGQVLLQQVRTPRYLVEYYVFYFIRQMTVLCRRPAGLQSLLSLKGAVEHRIGQLSPMQLAQSECILVDGSGGAAQTVVPAAQECHLLHTSYSRELYPDLTEAFPYLEQDRPNQRRSFFLSPQPYRLPSRVLETVREQFRAQPRPELQRAFFELKVKETLFLLLAEQEAPAVAPPLDARKLALAEAARAYICRDLSQHYSINDLARAVGTNEADLKRVFRQVYGCGMFHFLQRLRFEKAHELLLCRTHTIKQVAAAVGYRHTTTFITEFRKYFGYTPSSVSNDRR